MHFSMQIPHHKKEGCPSEHSIETPEWISFTPGILKLIPLLFQSFMDSLNFITFLITCIRIRNLMGQFHTINSAANVDSFRKLIYTLICVILQQVVMQERCGSIILYSNTHTHTQAMNMVIYLFWMLILQHNYLQLESSMPLLAQREIRKKTVIGNEKLSRSF